MRTFVLLLAIGVTCCSAFGLRGKQRYRVTGTVFCQSDPAKAAGVKVKLYDVDSWSLNDEISSAVTGTDGRFDIEGTATDPLGKIEPRLVISHRCRVSRFSCKREWKFKLPQEFINEETLRFGRINLDVKLPKSHHDCI